MRIKKISTSIGWAYKVNNFYYWKWGFGFGEGYNFEFQVNHPSFFFIWRWYPFFSLEIKKWWKFKIER
jgi:hypothetical protein